MNREAVEAYAENVDDSRERAATEGAVEVEPDETEELRGEDPVELSDAQADEHEQEHVAESPDPEADEQVTEPSAPVTEPLLAPSQAEEFFERWSEVQIAFVEDPRKSVTDAEALLSEVAAAYQEAVEERRSRLSAVNNGDGATFDTEALRSTLLGYREIMTTMLSK
jgi:hypothetical protein